MIGSICMYAFQSFFYIFYFRFHFIKIIHFSSVYEFMSVHSQAFSENIKLTGIASYLAGSLMSQEWNYFFVLHFSFFILQTPCHFQSVPDLQKHCHFQTFSKLIPHSLSLLSPVVAILSTSQLSYKNSRICVVLLF